MRVTTLYLENASQAAIFAFEIRGQISDGHWENSRPMNHWKWVCAIDFNINEQFNPSYGGPKHKTYDVMGLIRKMISGKKDWEWGIRVYQKAKLARVYPEIEKHLNNCYIGYIAEYLPMTKTMEYDEFVEEISKEFHWRKDYLEKANMTKEIYDAFYAEDYTMKEFKYDAMILDEALRTQI